MGDNITNKCIFCKRVIVDYPTKEHIILSCLGGNTITTTTICSVCNNDLNSKVDVHLKNDTLYIRYLLQLKSSKGKGTIELRGADSNKGKINIDSDGKIIVQTIPFEVKNETVENGQMKMVISIKGGSDSEYHKNLEKARQMINGKYGNDALRQFEDSIKESVINTNHYSQVLLNTKVGIFSYDCCRTAAKMLLIYWAYKTSNDEVLKKCYKNIKNVIEDHKDYSRVSILVPQKPIENMINALENYLYIESDSNGDVIGYFQLFGGLVYKIKIAEGTDIKNEAYQLSSYPFPYLKDEDKNEKREILAEKYDELLFVNLEKYAPLVDPFIKQFMGFISYYSEQNKIPKVVDSQMQNFQQQKALDIDSIRFLKLLAQDLYGKLLPQKGFLMQLLNRQHVKNNAIAQIVDLYIQNTELDMPCNMNSIHIYEFLQLILKDFFDVHEPTVHPFEDFQ